MGTLPKWALEITPVDMDGAAALLGISRRFLVDEIKKHPHYERRGAKKVFYPEHIALLREAISCQGSSSSARTASGTLPEPSQDSAFEKALRLATGERQKKSGRNTKPRSGNVIPMARQR